MKFAIGLLLALAFSVGAACAGPTSFQHVVVIVQENRTPDNLFYALCSTHPCGTHPDDKTYDIQTANWLNKDAEGGVTQPAPVSMAALYSPAHSHQAFTAMCDLDGKSGACRMDGAAGISCNNCPPDAEFKYVDDSQHVVDPYLFLATQYGWANYMFQTNQGPSFPAHQFLFGATSAPSNTDDHVGTFVAENIKEGRTSFMSKGVYGCLAPASKRIQLIDAKGHEGKNAVIYPCFNHHTVSDLLDNKAVTWRYYTPGGGSLWSAPDAIRHICQPKDGKCTGKIWQDNVSVIPPTVLTDIAGCNLRDVSWVIPSGQYSDHPKSTLTWGPAWVAAVVNAIGNSTCRNADNSTYWDSTAIIITWDDWGGWYDHEPPTILPYPEGGYQYGFRVPFIFVSAYTAQGHIDNARQDFGSVVRFIENNFGIRMGALTFADARSSLELKGFFDLGSTPRTFQTVAAPPFPFVGKAMGELEPPDDD